MRKINISPDEVSSYKDKFFKDFEAMVAKYDPFGSSASFNFVASFGTKLKDIDHVKLHFTKEAWRKMFALVDGFSSEIGWHGLVNRKGPKDFEVYDILIYPQEVTGITVNTDQAAYNEWFDKIPDDKFNDLHFQGHSHVTMGVSPSSVDLDNQSRLINSLSANGWYIFVIVNKSKSISCRIYDKAANVMYDESDVDFTYEPDPSEKLLEEAKKIVKSKSSYSTYGAIKYGDYGYTQNGVFHPYGTQYEAESKSKKEESGANMAGKCDAKKTTRFPALTGLNNDTPNDDWDYVGDDPTDPEYWRQFDRVTRGGVL